MKKLELILLLFLFVGAIIVRLYHFTYPIADWHSWRQVDTSAVSRYFVDHGFDIMHPHFEDISNVPSGRDNPQGYRFVEFPIYNVLQAGGYVLFKTFTLEEWGRIVTIFASLFSLLFIYLLVRKYISVQGAFFAAAFFAFNPFNIYYSRVVLPDPSMVALTLGTIYFFDIFLDKLQAKKSWIFFFSLTVLLGALALLLKPYAIFFFLPMGYLCYRAWQWKMFKKWFLWVALFLAILPFGLWRVWMTQYPEGIPASGWLFNGGNIRFTGAFFYWIFANRFARTILGLWGLPIFLTAFLSRRKAYYFFLTFVLSSLLYLVIIARGNVQHDYYQILIVPSIALMIGLGVDRLIYLPKEYGRRLAVYTTIIVCTVASLGFSWYYVRNNYAVNGTAVAVGKIVDQETPKNAKILTFQDGDTTFLYFTKRQGWASLEKSLPEMITMGADYIAILNPTESDKNGFGKEYTVVSQADNYLLIDLHKPVIK